MVQFPLELQKEVAMVPMLGKLIIFEGTEGSGKTTQAELLAKYALARNKRALLTKEPGGGDKVCRSIHDLLLDPGHKDKLSFRAEALLFMANRAQHVEYVIKPALFYNPLVISDRYEASTFAYQYSGRRAFKCAADLRMMNHFATSGISPDLTIWLDIEPATGLARNAHKKEHDRLEMEDIEFHKRVREGYATYFNEILAENEEQRDKWVKLDGSADAESLHREIVRILIKKRLI